MNREHEYEPWCAKCGFFYGDPASYKHGRECKGETPGAWDRSQMALWLLREAEYQQNLDGCDQYWGESAKQAARILAEVAVVEMIA